MNTQKFDIDDPSLTAFALGETADAEAVREALSQDREAKEYVEDLRDIARVLELELGAEAQPRLLPVQREKVLAKGKPIEKKRYIPSLGFASIVTAILVLAFFAREEDSAMYRGHAKIEAATDQAMDEPEAPREKKTGLAREMQKPAAPSMAMGFAAGSGGARGFGKAKGLGAMSEGNGMALHDGSAPAMDYAEQESFDQGHWNTEAYSHQDENGWKKVAHEPLSTFSIDVDTASYANVRRFLNQGQLPPTDAVRIEELVNYFPYSYAPPTDGQPFAVHVETAETPWTDDHRLVRIALKGKELAPKERPRLNLVFLVDVSGSMDAPNRLPLVRESLKLLVEQLQPDDRVGIVTYANGTGVALPPTSGENKQKILSVIDTLSAGGGTNGAGGIEAAYRLVKENFVKGGANRVVLCTDGDFNVGVTSEGELVRMIKEKAKDGAFLTILGFGMGNYKDATLVKLADSGNGNYAYVDSLAEAKKALVEQASGTLITIAKDVKIQVEFNPAYVGSYRLIGYEKRLLAKEDFNDDKKDAGEIGAGHTVTALYEITAPGEDPSGKSMDPLKYGKSKEARGEKNGEMLTVKLRYKDPDGDKSKLLEVPVKDEKREFAAASPDFKFASAVAAFGMLLRGSEHKGASSFEAVAATAEKNLEVKGKENEHRREFVQLVRKAAELKRAAK